MRSKTVLVLAIAFVIGTITTGTLVYASGEKNGTPFEQIWEAIHNLETVPISLGMPSLISTIERTEMVCPFSVEKFQKQVTGPIVLLSDGTVKVPSPTVGFTTPDPLFGSLPAGVWHDIEVNVYDFSSGPEGCFTSTSLGFSEETIGACAVASNGDVYCVDGEVTDGISLDGTPWTFQGNALP